MLQSYGGYTAVAAELTRRYKRNRQGKPFTRQQVWVWYSRRAINGFPGQYEFEADGKPVRLFRLAEVDDWYVSYVPSRGGRPKRNQEEERDGEADSGDGDSPGD